MLLERFLKNTTATPLSVIPDQIVFLFWSAMVKLMSLKAAPAALTNDSLATKFAVTKMMYSAFTS